jgi:hypothetical protein
MVAYSFHPQFVTPILAGTKRQTIRADRKRHAREGEAIQLYTGMRTKHCRAIGTANCQLVLPVTLDFAGDRVMTGGTVFRSSANLEEFARWDGFADWPAMRDFWRETHASTSVFSGVLIRWIEFNPARAEAAESNQKRGA